MIPEPHALPAAPRRAARDLIEAVLENMRNNLEPLRYSTLVPSRYLIYLHPAEHARLEGILPILEKETTRALTEELQKLNRRPAWRRHVYRFLGPSLEVQNGEKVDRNLEVPLPAEAEIGLAGAVFLRFRAEVSS